MLNRLMLLSLILLISVGCGCKTLNFSSSVESSVKPWSDNNFACAGKDDFHFAIMGDRTGGLRKGIFAKCLKEASLLEPDFVISVGDYIEGVKSYNPRTPANKDLLVKQYNSFDEIVKKNCSVPFFRLPGNHDLTSAMAYDVWAERYGSTYYWFKYKNVLFLCLNSGDIPENPESPGLSEAQIKWAIKALKKNDDVLWTFVFMHHPLWLYDDNLPRYSPKITRTSQSDTGFSKIENVLNNRNYMVFSGHTHAYRKYKRKKMEYYVLGLSGGWKEGVGFDRKKGILDHFAWVSFSNGKPLLTNIAIGNIMNSFWNNPALCIESDIIK